MFFIAGDTMNAATNTIIIAVLSVTLLLLLSVLTISWIGCYVLYRINKINGNYRLLFIRLYQFDVEYGMICKCTVRKFTVVCTYRYYLFKCLTILSIYLMQCNNSWEGPPVI